MLIGRDREFAACNALLSHASDQGGVLLLRGSAGIGKTALLSAARVRAEALGFQILSTAGSEAEAKFAFSGLQPLLFPVLDRDGGVPRHLRAALRSALGLTEADIPALPTVGLAVLGLLSNVATTNRPLCLIVDDVHWLDASSAEVLRFLSRRLSADPIVFLAAGREDGWPPPGAFPELAIHSLETEDAEALLALRPDLMPSSRRGVLAQAQGNPLALVELPAALAAANLRPTRSHETLPLTARLEASFMGRVDSLLEETRTALLVAALAPTASLPELLAATGSVVGRQVDISVLDEAVRLRLVDVDNGKVRFRHPLVRSGVVQGVSTSSTQVAHQALGDALADSERALYHRAQSHIGYNETLADELHEAAARALRRRSPESAVSALELAASLTARTSRRGGRLAMAAQIAFDLGRSDEARRFLSQVELRELERADRATARRLALMLEKLDGDDPRPVYELVALADEAIKAGDNAGAVTLLESAATRLHWGEPGIGARRAIVAAARRIPVKPSNLRIMAILSVALPGETHIELDRLLAEVPDAEFSDSESAGLAGGIALFVGEYERSIRLLDQSERELRRDALLGPLAGTLSFRGASALFAGKWLLCEELLDEAERLSADTDQSGWVTIAQMIQAGIAGLLGDQERHDRIADEAERLIVSSNASHSLRSLHLMRGMTSAMLGRADEAMTTLGLLFQPAERTYDARICYDAFFYLADAAIVTDRRQEVKEAIEVMTATVPAPWPMVLRSAVDYARAVIAEDTNAEDCFDVALSGPAASRPFDRARVEFAYGRWLRRHQQRLDARTYLRLARDTFGLLGNEPFAKRARDELRAAGEVSPHRQNADWEQLSPQEVQIARLVTQGLSNKQIGERLFLSHRTVASHLYRVFPKLGITSRAQLREVDPPA